MRAATTDTEAMMAICPLSWSSSRPATDPLKGIHVFPVPPLPYHYARILFLKQIRMTAGSFKNNLLLLIFIDKQPVRFNMAIPSSLISCSSRTGNRMTFFIFSLSFPLFNILLRSRSNCLVYEGESIQIPSLSNISSTLSHRVRFLPASVSSRVFFVVLLGTTTLKGSPFRNCTWL